MTFHNKIAIAVLLTLDLFLSIESVPVELRTSSDETETSVRKRSPTVSERWSCAGASPPPPNRVDTGERLRNLRRQMNLHDIQAYIITSDNAHQSEMVAAVDLRRQFISGFDGSAATSVVTQSAASLWTDGRYFDQAEQQLDCNWILMKQGNRGVPTITEWLQEVLTDDEDRVAADPTLVAAETWLQWQQELGAITLNALPSNLIDEIWNQSNGRRAPNQQPAYILPLKYSGIRWQDKVDTVLAEFPRLDIDALVVTALDEVAWLLNIRAADIPNEPLLMSYLYVSSRRIVLFADVRQIPQQLEVHLNTLNCSRTKCVTIRPYDRFIPELIQLIEPAVKVLVPKKYSYTGGSSYAVYKAVPDSKRVMKTSPVLLLKAVKNTIEVAGMKNAHLKDAVAVCDFFSQLDQEVSTNYKRYSL